MEGDPVGGLLQFLQVSSARERHGGYEYRSQLSSSAQQKRRCLSVSVQSSSYL